MYFNRSISSFIILTFIISGIATIASAQKQYKQKIFGTWCNQDQTVDMSKMPNYLRHVYFDIFRFNKNGKGYLKKARETTLKTPDTVIKTTKVVVVYFDYYLLENEKGKYVSVHYTNGKVISVDPFEAASNKLKGKKENSLTPHEYVEKMSGKKHAFYYRIAPDINNFNIKSLHYIKPNQAVKTYQSKPKKYDKWW